RDNFLWATNEDTDGYDLRLLSSEDYDPNLNDWPYLEIIWSENLRTVYFLKDHLGSIRATVDAESDTVVGYDDYDAWGLILAGRSLATPWSSVQGTARTSLPREIKAVKFPDRVSMLAIIGLHRQAPINC
nr:hypothetical protein [candidate division KSB1 bacterium]NIR71410.1 hypothetical protein [candidate division KSB1 bacterium]NIS26312.1 hypothetical protein [candidate division KSB1 bacterium]NIT73075.1 hypothetical protein [candidate division KSB1 bacterium]NIU26982.1 hypothetical protein [candidate division KSB1 bacterium]